MSKTTDRLHNAHAHETYLYFKKMFKNRGFSLLCDNSMEPEISWSCFTLIGSYTYRIVCSNQEWEDSQKL